MLRCYRHNRRYMLSLLLIRHYAFFDMLLRYVAATAALRALFFDAYFFFFPPMSPSFDMSMRAFFYFAFERALRRYLIYRPFAKRYMIRCYCLMPRRYATPCHAAMPYDAVMLLLLLLLFHVRFRFCRCLLFSAAPLRCSATTHVTVYHTTPYQ